jgi:hypothetical protein
MFLFYMKGIKSKLTNLLGRPFALRALENQQCGGGVQISQRLFSEQLRNHAAPLDFREIGFSIYSEFEEDGILLAIFSVIGHGNRLLVEIGCGSGNQNNSANLIINNYWNGLLIDADEQSCSQANTFFRNNPHTKLFQPTVLCSTVTPSNVNNLLREHVDMGLEVDLLSLDIDSIDIFVLEALTVIQPRVILVEVNARWKEGESKTYPIEHESGPVFDPELGMIFGGASLEAFQRLMRRKGYKLIGSNSMSTNCFYLRCDISHPRLPEVSAASVLNRPRALSIQKRCRERLGDFPWAAYQ